MHYVIGDVHGCFDELMALLEKIESQDANAQFIFVGDLIDRGAQVWDVLTWAIDHISPDGKYQCVRGNHEELVLEWYEVWSEWWEEGGFLGEEKMPETHYDFTKLMDSMNLLQKKKLVPYMELFRSFPLRKELDIETKSGKKIHYRIAHAWDSLEKGLSEEDRKQINIWSRDCVLGNQENDDIIVHGHTPTIASEYWQTGETAPGMIGYRDNAINVDGGCCFSVGYYRYPCMLCAICLETLEEFYPYLVEERLIKLNEETMSPRDAEEYAAQYRLKYLQKQNPFREAMLQKWEDAME